MLARYLSSLFTLLAASFQILISFRNLELQNEISEIVGIRDVDEKCPENPQSARKWCRRLTQSEWNVSRDLLEALAPLNVTTQNLQATNTPTISIVIPYIEMIRRQCLTIQNTESKSPIVRKVAKAIYVGINKRFSPVFLNPIYAIATLIDPLTKRFYTSYVPSSVRDVVKKFLLSKIAEESENVQPAIKTFASLHSLLEQNRDPHLSCDIPSFKLDAYLSEPVTSDQVPSFLARQPKVLRDLYLSICGIPAASSDVERLFSTCGIINSKLRCSMDPRNVEDRALLKKNASNLSDFAENTYPASTPKLTNWLGSLPQLQSPFYPFEDDTDEGKDEWEMEERNVESDSEGEDEKLAVNELRQDEWWVQTNATKSFSQSMKEFEAQLQTEPDQRTTRNGLKRKRGEDDTRIVKRRKIERQGLTRPPKLGQKVMIHYTTDCKCKKPPLECDCDLWYEGTILEELPKDVNGDRVFYIDFECGDDDKIIWKMNEENDYWAQVK